MGGRFGKLATCYWVSAGYVPRFTPPEGSFVNFLAQMTNTVLRYRGGKVVPWRNGRATRPEARIALPIRNTRAIEISTVLCHDLRWVPTRLAKKIPVGARFKGACHSKKLPPPAAATTSPIDQISNSGPSSSIGAAARRQLRAKQAARKRQPGQRERETASYSFHISAGPRAPPWR